MKNKEKSQQELDMLYIEKELIEKDITDLINKYQYDKDELSYQLYQIENEIKEIKNKI